MNHDALPASPLNKTGRTSIYITPEFKTQLLKRLARKQVKLSTLGGVLFRAYYYDLIDVEKLQDEIDEIESK